MKEPTSQSTANHDSKASEQAILSIPIHKPKASPSASSQAPQTLLLFPGGIGNALAYAHLPPISAPFPLATHALNIPPTITSPDALRPPTLVSDLWHGEIEALQPSVLGGYSVGGYMAFEAAQQVRGAVRKLIFIDTPPPHHGVVSLTAIHLADKMRLRGPKPTPAPLAARFAQCLEGLTGYAPLPLRDAAEMTVYMLWSSRPALDPELTEEGRQAVAREHGVDVLGNESMRWIWMADRAREPLGPRGWEGLLPGARIWVAQVEGHHFGLLQPGSVESVAKRISEAVADGEAGAASSLAKLGWQEYCG